MYSPHNYHIIIILLLLLNTTATTATATTTATPATIYTAATTAATTVTTTTTAATTITITTTTTPFLMHTLLICVEASISIYIRLERYGKISMDQQRKTWLMPPYHLAWITVTAYYMEQNNPTSTDYSAARIMQPGLYLKGASLTILALCWENCIGFPWSIGSVTKFCSSPTRHWMAILHNISQH